MTPYPQTCRAVRIWIYTLIALVFCMVVVGGLTRLTESGLSIVEWKLVTGILPPLSESAWEAELQEYRSSPQYQQINKGMSIDEFKNIYWLEYIHRLLGRLVGIAFIVPLAAFWITGRLPPPLNWKMLGITALVGVQGIVGWYMVKSGLVDVPWVSPYRLAFHLGLAVVIFCTLLHVAYTAQLSEKPSNAPPEQRGLRRMSLIITLLVFIQILMGALVAGLDAGLTYNTWPLMDGQLAPSGLLLQEPVIRNFFEHVPMVQFQHRWFAFVLLTLIMYQHFRLMILLSGSRVTQASLGLICVCVVQIVLGIATLLYHVPIDLAVVHQAVACVLIGFCVLIHHMLYYSPSMGLDETGNQSCVRHDAADNDRDEKGHDDQRQPANAGG